MTDGTHRPRPSLAVVRLSQGLALPAIGVGVAGGLVGAAYLGLLHVLDPLLGPDHHSAPARLAVLTATGVLVALITRHFGETGNVELLVDNIHVLGGADDVRSLRTLVPTSLLCVASGAAMGPEAPLVQTTGSLGTVAGTRLERHPSDVRVLTITGMAAGFAVLFGAPMGAALFALEILHRRGLQYHEALLPAVVGALCGYATSLTLRQLSIAPIWHFPGVGPLAPTDLVVAAGLGLLGAALAMLFATSAQALGAAVSPLPRPVRYIGGGLLLGLLGWWSPFALTFGEDQLGGIAEGRLAAGALAVALAAKFLGTTVTLAAGWKGGFIIPLLFMGVTLGRLAQFALPSVNPSVLMACVMVAACAGVTKTPLGSTLVVTEMAGLPLLPVVLTAAVVAVAATNRVHLIETQRSRAVGTTS